MVLDFEHCYRAVQSRDSRFDGWFYTAVRSTGIYCRPSCPALTPRRRNVAFYRTAASAQTAGFRACKRCRPDASPGSPEWNVRTDLVGRAMRLIADGVVDRHGVAGLAQRLGFSERHLHRQLVDEVGAGARALARAQRAHTGRLLLQTTDLPASAVAFAAGFASIRQFNETVREVFAATPTALRRLARRSEAATPGSINLRLPYRPPLDADGLFSFLATRAVPGLEAHAAGTYQRTLALPHRAGIVELSAADDHVRCRLLLEDLRDLAAAVQRCRRLLDLDADPIAIGQLLARDPALAGLVDGRPGRRVPGCVDGGELAIRAVLGQQISVTAARTLVARLVARYGQPLEAPRGPLMHLFPPAGVLADASLDDIPLPAARRRTLRALCEALTSGTLDLDPGADRREAERKLLALPGIGPWTAAYIAMRALGDPDAFPATDLGLRRAAERLGLPKDPEALVAHAERWRPWRAYAASYLWGSLSIAPGPERLAITQNKSRSW